MVGRQPPQGRSAGYAWLITAPLALLTAFAIVIMWVNDRNWYEPWPQGLLLFASFIAAYVGVLNFTVRRSVFNVVLTDIPLLLAFHYLTPVMVIFMVGAASAIVQWRLAPMPAKACFNVAKSAASATAALLVIAALPHRQGVAEWLVLFTAIIVNQLVELGSITAVMATVQNLRAAQEATKVWLPTLGISTGNVAIGLVFLAALTETAWAAVPLLALIVTLALARRSYTD